MHYYEVAPTRIIRTGSSVLTYASENSLSLGQIVQIEIGSRQQIGVVLRKVDRPEFDVKQIQKVLEPTPLPGPLLQTIHWMSEYYATPLPKVLQTALPRGINKQRRIQQDTVRRPIRKRTNFVFTKDQQAAISSIEKMSPVSALLHGVTGSGKTAVYIELSKRTIASGRSVLVLVPEISLTTQVVDEFSSNLPNVIVTHSNQTEAERHTKWRQILGSQEPFVIIGPRSALFMPLSSIGLIVIDECHEPSYKQEKSPRYSALRTARILADYHDAKLTLGSATPLVTDYFVASQTNRPILTMPTPARKNTVKPEISVVDMTKRASFRKHQFLSDALIDQLTKTLQSGHQALIFHNRRGSATTTLCQQCGWVATCPDTLVPLTLHADTHILRSHLTGRAWPIPTSCPMCGEAEIIHKGIGTKRIESELMKLFPKVKIARFDGDADISVENQYEDLYSGEIQLITGTQVIAKGLDLPKLRTVGIVQADGGLALPDYSSPERTFQLLAQVIGRVGRSHHPTRVIVQSYQPSHPAIIDALSQNYKDFYTKTLRERKRANFPPYTFLLKLICTYKTESYAIKHAKDLATTLKKSLPSRTTIMGPTPCFYERSGSMYRWQLVVKSPKRQDLLDALKFVPKTHWQFEIDPTSLL